MNGHVFVFCRPAAITTACRGTQEEQQLHFVLAKSANQLRRYRRTRLVPQTATLNVIGYPIRSNAASNAPTTTGTDL